MSAFKVWECQICGWQYDEQKGSPPDGLAAETRWEDIPDDWTCPECGVGKEDFDMIEVSRPHDATAVSAPLGKRSDDTPASGDKGTPLVIVGTGMAGYHLVKALRNMQSEQRIVMFTSDDGSYYSKPQLSTGFSSDKQAKDMASASAEEMAGELDAEINIFSSINHIDTQTRSLTLADGGIRHYSQLVLATGASCIKPDIIGDAISKTHQVNNLLDYAKFRAVLRPSDHILVIGAGLIGCEYADDLTRAGFRVTVVDPMPGALATLLPEEASGVLTDNLRKAGITFNTGTKVLRLDHTAHGVLAILSNGQTIRADRVLCAIGIRPDLSLARHAGIRCNRGIEVGKDLQTSESNVFAIGDCAEVNGTVLPYIAPLTAQVRALSNTLTGERTEVSYGVMPVMVKTKLHPVVVHPAPAVPGEWRIDCSDSTGVKARYINDLGELVGYALTGKQCAENASLMRQCKALI